MRHWRRGFTLIELLVVIAMIAILAAMLMPALESARERAGRLSCLGNLRQQALAFHMYSNDYDGFVPFQTDRKAGGGASASYYPPMRNVLPTYLGGSMPEEVFDKTSMECGSGLEIWNCPASADEVTWHNPPGLRIPKDWRDGCRMDNNQNNPFRYLGGGFRPTLPIMPKKGDAAEEGAFVSRWIYMDPSWRAWNTALTISGTGDGCTWNHPD
jgi:prepilin-type N-terminal cleavage/methylation domain-containing protein